MWQFNGKARPSFAEAPGPGQESVWDYPRPPSIMDDAREVVVKVNGVVVATTTRSRRVLETASPPTFYIPKEDVAIEMLKQSPGSSFCEWKGAATYWSFAGGQPVANIGWSYEAPSESFQSIAGYLSFYPALAECLVAGETARPQPGGFYGGWITSELVGPFKGEPGTSGW